MPEDHGLARRGSEKSEQHAHERRLAGSVRSEAAEYLAALDTQIDVIDGDARTEAPGKPAGLDDGGPGRDHEADPTARRTSAGRPGRRSDGASVSAIRAS